MSSQPKSQKFRKLSFFKKIKGIKKHPIKVFFGLLLVWFIVIEFQNFTGYCREEGRYLSEEELLKRGAGEIYRQNPDCCEILANPALSTKMNNFLNKLFGRYLYGLTMYYEKSGGKEPYYESYNYMTACGKVHNDFGGSISEQIYKKKIDSIAQDKLKKGNVNVR